MNSRLNAVWIQIKESSASMFPRTFRSGTSFLTALAFGLVITVAPNLYSQNSETPKSTKSDNVKIKVVTDKDGKTEVMEFNGDDILSSPEIAKTLKELKIDISKLKKDIHGANINVKRVIKTDGASTNDEDVVITCGGKGDKKECVVVVNGDSSKCKMNTKCMKKSSCVIQSSDSKDGKEHKMIWINKDGDSKEFEGNAVGSAMRVEIESDDANSSDKPKRIFIRKFKDDDGENISVIDADFTPNEGEVLINSNADGNHVNSMKFIIKQVNEDGDPSKVRVIIHKFVTDEVNTSSPKQSKVEEMPTALNLTTLNLAPNPNKGQFTMSFSLPETGNTEIIITDILGHQVYSESLNNFTGEYSKSLDLSSKARGEYLLKITQNGKSATANIVLE